MKNLILISMIIAAISFSACGQKGNVPAKVKAAFSQKFPDVTKVQWDKENDTEWEAEFKMNEKKYSANFSSEGIWTETEYEIKKSEIPKAVKATLESEFPEYEIEEAEVSETGQGIFYEFEMENDESEMEIVIDSNGKVVKKEVKEEDDDED